MNDNRIYSILIAGNEKHTIDALHLMLSPMYNTKIVENGKTAIKTVEGFHPDLIILDTFMPDTSGIDVLAHLKDSGLTSGIPVILTTGSDNDQDEEKQCSLARQIL